MSKRTTNKQAETDPSPAPGASGDDPLQRDLDKISLNQALADFEVANARVVDLTRRLVESSATVRSLTDELETLKIAHRALRTEHEQVVASKAFKIVQVIWAVRRSLRG